MKNDIRACLLITVSVHVFVQCTPSHTQTCTHKYVDIYISNNMGKIWINIPQNRKGFFFLRSWMIGILFFRTYL